MLPSTNVVSELMTQMRYIIVLIILATTLTGCSQTAIEPDRSTTIRTTVTELFTQLESNPIQFNERYKGKWIKVTGTIARIGANDKITVLQHDTLFEEVALYDLPHNTLVQLTKGQTFTATCKLIKYENLSDTIIPYLVITLQSCRASE